MNPIGRSVAGSGKALTFHERLQQNGGVLVSGVPIAGQAFGGQGEYLGRKVSRIDPGQDEKAGVVDDEVKVLDALLVVPADEVVACGDFPCSAAPAECLDMGAPPEAISRPSRLVGALAMARSPRCSLADGLCFGRRHRNRTGETHAGRCGSSRASGKG